MTPFLGIVIPTYNRARQLGELLDRLDRELRECDAEVEVLVSDNASQDETAELLQARLRTHPWLRAHRQPENIQARPNIAWLVENAPAADYTWIIGDDDLPLPGAVQFIVELLRAQRPAWLHLPHRWIDLDGHEQPGSTAPAQLQRFASPGEMYVAHHHWLTFMAASVLRTVELQRAARDLPTANAYHPLLWFFGAALGAGPCIVPDRYLVAGSLDISWTDRRAEILTLHFTSLWDEGLSADLSAEQFGRTLDGLYGSDGFDLGLWRTVGLDHLAEVVARFPQSRALRWTLLVFARDCGRGDLVAIVDQAARGDGAETTSERLVARGEQHFAAGDHEAAIGCFTEATRWLPTCTDAWNDHAVTTHHLGLDGARDYLEMALFIDPADQQALSNRHALLGVPYPAGQPAARA